MCIIYLCMDNIQPTYPRKRPAIGVTTSEKQLLNHAKSHDCAINDREAAFQLIASSCDF